ncbi:hypothetical protein [Hymenobacter negativus]|uniref:DUF3471 domain-containing protein n=1 Tax=Hymenobacter negativus TaxID=2795026 RepID=A0ABS3QAI2_9BACT|nr:hypothetical protein [Hymenobacter negativus]MBO2007839.1 hypothetical protein [Hymenobacter negativus]
MRCFLLHSMPTGSALLLIALLSGTARAQTARPLPNFFTTYTYTAYTVYDTTSTDPPTVVRGVGGTLTLNSTGSYAKRLSIAGNNGPMLFKQDGTFTLTGDSIRFAFRDQKGADVQRGTFRFNPTTRQLIITILGYPAGNRGVYELVAPEPQPKAPAVNISKKRRR